MRKPLEPDEIVAMIDADGDWIQVWLLSVEGGIDDGGRTADAPGTPLTRWSVCFR